jgi:hypothetical protein
MPCVVQIKDVVYNKDIWLLDNCHVSVNFGLLSHEYFNLF